MRQPARPRSAARATVARVAAATTWLLLAAAVPPIFAQPRLPVTDARTLMLAAFDAPEGAAAGVLTGPAAEAISQRFSSSAPILVDVRALRPLAHPGCRRLQVRFSQQGVQLPGTAAAGAQVIEFEVDFCRDGMPPQRAMSATPAARGER